MLINNIFYKYSFVTHQITPENYGSFLSSLLNIQLMSRNPFSGRIFFYKIYWPTPFNIYVDFRPLFRIAFAGFSRKYPYSQTPAISRGCTEGKAKTRGLGIWLSQSLTFRNLATASFAFSGVLLLPDAGRQWVATLYIIIIIPKFRETFAK